jgi:transcriptional regulator with XRE-family HTH domain
MYQVEFGKKLGVSQGAVSAWESDDEDRRPSADIYFRLATLAASPGDILFFLQKAGLSVETIVLATNKLAGDRIVRPQKGDNVLIAPVEQILPNLEFPSSLITNPLLTRYFKVDKHSMEHAAFEPGEVFLLDISDTALGGLEPFWDKLILAEIDFDKVTFGASDRRGKTIVAGWLVLSHIYDASAHAALATANLHPWIGASHKPSNEFDLSRSPESFTDDWLLHSRHPHPFSVAHETEASISSKAGRVGKSHDEFAKGYLRAGAHIRILGRIVGWFPSPSKGGK